METRNFDRIATSLAAPKNRRDTLRLFGAVVLGAGGVSLIAAEGEAKRGKRRKKSHKPKKNNPGQDNPPAPDPYVDIAITDILVEPTAEAAHDNLVVTFVNNGTLAASGFRIGMTATRTNGQIRNEVFSLPITLAPGQSGTEKFRLGCNWLNGGTVTARTDPSPVTGEPGAETANNTRSVTFGATICS